MTPLTIEQNRVQLVLDKISTLIIDNPDLYLEGITDGLDRMLDELVEEEFFGSENATDPRGDAREGEWSMYCVQSIDISDTDDEDADY